MKAQPFVCPTCNGEEYFGRLVFPDETEPPTCPNHQKEDGTVETVLLRPAPLITFEEITLA